MLVNTIDALVPSEIWKFIDIYFQMLIEEELIDRMERLNS